MATGAVPTARVIEILEHQIERNIAKIAILSEISERESSIFADMVDPNGSWTASHNGKIMGAPGPSMIKNPCSEITLNSKDDRVPFDPKVVEHAKFKAATRYHMGWTDPRATIVDINGETANDKASKEATKPLGNT